MGLKMLSLSHKSVSDISFASANSFNSWILSGKISTDSASVPLSVENTILFGFCVKYCAKAAVANVFPISNILIRKLYHKPLTASIV